MSNLDEYVAAPLSATEGEKVLIRRVCSCEELSRNCAPVD